MPDWHAGNHCAIGTMKGAGNAIDPSFCPPIRLSQSVSFFAREAHPTKLPPPFPDLSGPRAASSLHAATGPLL
eukprot:4750077-Pyramimonas_sp.AAC.1